MADWSQLPKELLLLIAKRFETHFDVLHFRSVCPNWRASVPINLQPHPFFCSPVPGIVKGQSLLFKRTFCLLQFQPRKRYSHKPPLFWLVLLEEGKFGRKQILHSFSRKRQFPRRRTMELDLFEVHVQELGREYVVESEHIGTKKVACFNANLNDYDHFLLLIQDKIFAFLRLFNSEDQGATLVKVKGWGRCVDFIQLKDKVYAIDTKGSVACIEPCSGASFLVSNELEVTCTTNDMFLVELCGKVLLVRMIGRGTIFAKMIPPILKFELFQLDEDKKRWDRLKSLGDGILFLGKYCNFSAPAIPGVQGNCIVFTLPDEGGARYDESMAEEHVFNLTSGMVMPLMCRPDLQRLLNSCFL